MNKLEHRLNKTLVEIKKVKEGSYEQNRLFRHFVRLWDRYVKQNQVPYNPTLLSELRDSYYLEVRK
jgi:hypothetical protein